MIYFNHLSKNTSVYTLIFTRSYGRFCRINGTRRLIPYSRHTRTTTSLGKEDMHLSLVSLANPHRGSHLLYTQLYTIWLLYLPDSLLLFPRLCFMSFYLRNISTLDYLWQKFQFYFLSPYSISAVRELILRTFICFKALSLMVKMVF